MIHGLDTGFHLIRRYTEREAMATRTCVLALLFGLWAASGAPGNVGDAKSPGQRPDWKSLTREAESLLELWSLHVSNEARGMTEIHQVAVQVVNSGPWGTGPKKVLMKTYWAIPDGVVSSVLIPPSARRTVRFTALLRPVGDLRFLRKTGQKEEVYALYSVNGAAKNPSRVEFKERLHVREQDDWQCAVFCMHVVEIIDKESHKTIGQYVFGKPRVVLFHGSGKAEDKK